MFIISGRVRLTGEIGAIRWDAGTISSEDAGLAEYVLSVFEEWEGFPVGPVGGPMTDRRHIRSALSSYIILSRIFEPNLTTVGDLPEPPDVPYGAVI